MVSYNDINAFRISNMKVRIKNGMNGLKIAQTKIWGDPRRRLHPPGRSLRLGKSDFQNLPAVSYALGAVAYGWGLLVTFQTCILMPLSSLILPNFDHTLTKA